jgi:hypothetical protein
LVGRVSSKFREERAVGRRLHQFPSIFVSIKEGKPSRLRRTVVRRREARARPDAE